MIRTELTIDNKITSSAQPDKGVCHEQLHGQMKQVGQLIKARSDKICKQRTYIKLYAQLMWKTFAFY